MTSRRYTPPRDHLTPDGTWPAGPYQPDTPGYALATADLVTNTLDALTTANLSVRAAARAAGISHATLLALLAGNTVPDLGTIRALETALNTPLWPPYRSPI